MLGKSSNKVLSTLVPGEIAKRIEDAAHAVRTTKSSLIAKILIREFQETTACNPVPVLATFKPPAEIEIEDLEDWA